MKHRLQWLDGNRMANQSLGIIILAHGMVQHAQKMERIRMIGILRKNREVFALRVFQSTGMVVFERYPERRRTRRSRRILPGMR